jgi:small GTP-binding protein
VDGQRVRLALWDTAGQEKFQTITKSFYKNTNGFLFVFDLSSLDSAKRLRDFWIKQVSENMSQPLTGYLVGNKRDLGECSESEQVIKSIVDQYGFRYFQISCLQDSNIDTIFEQLARDILLQQG